VEIIGQFDPPVPLFSYIPFVVSRQERAVNTGLFPEKRLVLCPDPKVPYKDCTYDGSENRLCQQ
jgi:hypothetical protein